MRLVRLIGGIFAVSTQRALAHRTNFLFAVLMSLIQIGSGVAVLAVIFSQTETLAGWGPAQSLVLLGAFQLISGLLLTFVEPNLDFFAQRVTRGELDDALLLPLPSLFTASLGRCRPLALPPALIGLLLMATGIARSGAEISLGNLTAGLLLLMAGLVIGWAARVLLAAIAFWAPGFEATVLYFAFWQLGRYPIQIYPRAIQQLLTFVIPVAFVSTFPAQRLTGGGPQGLPWLGAAAAAVAVAVACGVWRAGLRRYTGATS